MIRRSRPSRRLGAAALEFAVIAPAAFFLIFGIIIGGLGTFRYQCAAHAVREGARYAAVHGADYRKEYNQTPLNYASVNDFRKEIFDNGMKHQLGLLGDVKESDITVTVTNAAGTTETSPCPPAPHKAGMPVTANAVTVRIEAKWLPVNFWGMQTTMSAQSTMHVSY